MKPRTNIMTLFFWNIVLSLGVCCLLSPDCAATSSSSGNNITAQCFKTMQWCLLLRLMVQPLTLEKHATTHLETASNENPMTKPNFLDVVLNRTASKGSKLITNMRNKHIQNLNYCGLFIKDDHTYYPPLLLMLKRLFKIQSFNSS
jgi:hypothetical protein